MLGSKLSMWKGGREGGREAREEEEGGGRREEGGIGGEEIVNKEGRGDTLSVEGRTKREGQDRMQGQDTIGSIRWRERVYGVGGGGKRGSQGLP